MQISPGPDALALHTLQEPEVTMRGPVSTLACYLAVYLDRY